MCGGCLMIARIAGPSEQTQKEVAAAAQVRKDAENKIRQDIGKHFDEFVAVAKERKIDGIATAFSIKTQTLVITVKDLWHTSHKQQRLQVAQSLRALWVSIHCPSMPDLGRIEIVDANGNVVGGSEKFRADKIWVQD